MTYPDIGLRRQICKHEWKYGHTIQFQNTLYKEAYNSMFKTIRLNKVRHRLK